MKLTTLIVLAFCQIALANTYPKFTSGSNILVQSEAIRFRAAPFYGETRANTISVENVRTGFKQYSIGNLTENASNRLIADVPQFSNYKLSNQKQITQTAALDGKQVSTTRNLAEINPVNSNSIETLRTFAQTAAFNRMQQVVSTKNIAEIATVDTPDPFSIRLEFDWVEPHGQFMQQLLTDIKAAKAAGNTETYKKLTAQYQAWADQYLIKGTPPMVME